MDYSGFIRVREGNLETSITSYRKGKSLVTLIACDHVAEEDYFKTLEEKANAHDIVIYEPFAKDETRKGEAEAFGLHFQPYAIDYGNLPSHWLDGEERIDIEPEDIEVQGEAEDIIKEIVPLVMVLQQEAMESGTKEDNIRMKLRLLYEEPFQAFSDVMGRSLEPRRRFVIRTFEELDSESNSVAFLYGAGHAVFFEQYLLAQGYEEATKGWIVSVRM